MSRKALIQLSAQCNFSDKHLGDLVLQILADAVDDPHIEVILSASRLLLSQPDKVVEPKLAMRMADGLTKVANGKLNDEFASNAQRGQALRCLSRLRDRASRAVSLLIGLLKSNDLQPPTKDRNSRSMADGFTRHKVIMTLAAIGPPAKDALPILEAELATFEKQAKEDALLTGVNEPRGSLSNGSTTNSLLRMAIRAINGEQPVTFFRD